METAKLFANGRSQAVRLPKSCRFEGSEVLVRKVGEAVILLPMRHPWKTLVDSLDMFEPGFSITRDQPRDQQKRAPLKP